MPARDEDELRTDAIIEAIFDALPAKSYAEIVAHINRHTRLNVNLWQVNNAIAVLRENSAYYGWTIPHVKRGQNTDRDEGKIIAYLVDREGHYELDVNPDAGRHLNKGMVGTLKQTYKQMKHISESTRIAATHTRSINKRARLNELADDFAYLSRRAKAVVRDLEADDDEEAA